MKRLTYLFLSIGMLLSSSLSAQSPLPYPLDTIDGQIYYRYTVERSIGLYRISKNFGVSQEEILRANPQVQQQGLRYDEEILIPAKGLQVEPVVAPAEKVIKQPVVREDEKRPPLRGIKYGGLKKLNKTQVDSTVVDSTAIDSLAMDSIATDSGQVIRLAALLPLHAEAIERDKNMDRFYDFYAGMLLAVNEVQEAGQKIEVFTYDIGKGTQKIETLQADSNWQRMDAIVGPAYGQQVTIASEMAQRDSTWLLIPFLPNVASMDDNPYLLKFNPSPKVVADTLAKYLKQYGDSVNCVIFEPSSSDMIPQSINYLHQALKKHHVPTTTTTLRALLSDSLESSFAKGKENILIFNTEKYGNLQGVMPHLLKACGTYQITLYSQYLWQNEKIVLPQIYTSVFMDNPIVPAAYDSVYNAYFAHPLASTRPRYDLLGYDQTRHLLQLLQAPTDSIATSVWYGVQSNIQYVPLSEKGGHENQMIHIIRK